MHMRRVVVTSYHVAACFRREVAIRRPLMRDEETHRSPPQGPDPVPATREEADGLDHVYADAMAFGMGACCLQVRDLRLDLCANDSR